VYPDADFELTLELIDKHGGGFALTGAIFANDLVAIRKAGNKLRYAAGNFYIDCRTTSAVIGQQTSGGSRASGTCDKAGSISDDAFHGSSDAEEGLQHAQQYSTF